MTNNINTFTQAIKEKVLEGADAAKEFLVETPTEVFASAITGVVLQFFKTRLALPSYGVVIGSTLSRFAVILIAKIRYGAASAIIEKTNQFHEKFAIIPVILLIAATVLAWFVPIAGFATGLAIGLYYGPIAERKRLFSQQEIPNNINEKPQLGF